MKAIYSVSTVSKNALKVRDRIGKQPPFSLGAILSQVSKNKKVSSI